MSFTSMEIGGVRYNGHMQAGIYSFLKTPIMENPTEEKLREAGVKAAIMGIPFDGGTMSRVGQSNGPRSIRESSQCFSPMHVDYNINFAEKLRLHDCSDSYICVGDAKKTLGYGKDVAAEILKAGALPVILGGEHTVSYAGTWAMDKVLTGKFGYIHLDAHIDADENFTDSEFNQGVQVARISELESFPTENMVLLGLRGSTNLDYHFDWCKNKGITTLTMNQVLQTGIERAFEQAIEIATRGTDGFYLSIDLDFLDPAYAPGVCDPVPCGLTTREFWSVIPKLAANEKLKAFDVVELVPYFDQSKLTAVTAVAIIVEMLAARASIMGS